MRRWKICQKSQPPETTTEGETEPSIDQSTQKSNPPRPIMMEFASTATGNIAHEFGKLKIFRQQPLPPPSANSEVGLGALS